MSAKTHMVIKTDSSNKSTLEARAARFKSLTNSQTAPATALTGTTSVPTASKTTDPAEAEKLAKRAARFADVTGQPAVATSGKVTLSGAKTSVADAELLAKRAARFGQAK